MVTLSARRRRRRSQGLTVPPRSITLATIGAVAAAGVVLVWVCNLNRGTVTALQGVPWVLPILILILVAWSFLLARTRLGRYIYAIGASPEAARRAGINVALIRTAGLRALQLHGRPGRLVYESRLGSMSVGFDGGT